MEKEIKMPKSMGNPAPKQAAVQSIYRAAGVLACIGNHVNSMTDIAQACKLSNSTVHRLLQALEDSDMVIQDPISRRYYFGDLITRLVSDIQVPYEYFITVSKEHLSTLAEKTGETISLAVMVGQQYNALFEIPSRHKLRVVEAGVNAVEMLEPAGATAKVLLSQLSDKELEIRVRNIRLTHQIEDPEAYLRQIREIRHTNYTMTVDEVIPGAMCISSAVTHYISPAVVSIFGPRERMAPHSSEYTKLLLSATQAISGRLAETIKAKPARN
jgi:IclR family transcriptional regulator, acetate operon repressor